MAGEWVEGLSDSDLAFVRSFILASGSLKEVAKLYNVSYPTIRHRLNRLIQKVEVAEQATDEFTRRLRAFAVNKGLSAELVDSISEIHHKSRGEAV